MNTKYLKLILFVVLGGVAGYSYYHFVGCSNGCAITGNPYISTTYGAFMGLVLGFPSKKKNDKTENNQRN